MRVIHRLILLIMVLSILPGVGELLENIEHLVHDGHAAHVQLHPEGEDEAHALVSAEHGCTAISHTCGCHASIPAILPEAVTPETPVPNIRLSLQHEAWGLRFVTRANAPPVRPPIS